ncbi:bifunctional isocitrate dehydrogenase kinase/phosphatase [Roseivirga sp. BDSF3-8]|uniref:bifunctional isocitrate dehydrogenase kinase/phosphatase n=1 Tax=Roseivirga sp. BDSF3-8 TaxID=3241598 RepID=UPI0035322334
MDRALERSKADISERECERQARVILDAFVEFHREFMVETSLAKDRFENRDWKGQRHATAKRQQLHENHVLKLKRRWIDVVAGYDERPLHWKMVKEKFAGLCTADSGPDICRTFYNSFIRRLLGGQIAEHELVFTFEEESDDQLAFYSYDMRDKEATFSSVLDLAGFTLSFEDRERDIRFLMNEVASGAGDRLEMCPHVFYRNVRAYLVGRLRQKGHFIPILIPIVHGEKGLKVDALITSEIDCRVIFSFTRSYFQVIAYDPTHLVNFLMTLMPNKQRDQLFINLGFHKHGKSLLYQSLKDRLNMPGAVFAYPPGIKGMVMAVFMLQGYTQVFKVIRNKAKPPKKVTRYEVMAKYRYVAEHDRGGRLADTQEFRNLILPKDRFALPVLEELLSECSETVRVEGESVIFSLVYTERWMMPLSEFVKTARGHKLRKALFEYGEAISDLAMANIFPGDLFMKNFGITPEERVIFYDYDEIMPLGEMNFRSIPQQEGGMGNYQSAEPWFAVGENDVFPEQFRNFLVPDPAKREVFEETHSHLYDPLYWENLRKRHLKDEYIDICPYEKRKG